MVRYRAFGLTIESELPIPELMDGEQEHADVLIRYGHVESPQFDAENPYSKVEKTGYGYKCYIKDIGGVRVEGGSEIVVCPLGDAEERGFRFLVTGIALGLLLHQRGFVTIHASAVSIRDHAVGFMGEKGTGKSTTACAFHVCGYPVVTDDLLVLDVVDGTVVAHPGFPHLKLNPDSIESSLEEDPNRFPKVDPCQGMNTKRSFNAGRGFVRRSLPLQSIYVLDYHDENASAPPQAPTSEEIKGGQACIELVRNSYVLRLLPEEGISRGYLDRCAEIAQAISVHRIRRNRSLAHLSTLVSFVEREVTEVVGQDRTHLEETSVS